MFKFITNRLGVRIALLVNLFLAVMIVTVTLYIYVQQTKQMKGQLLSKGRILSMIGARSISRIIEEAIANGVFSKEDAFDTNYELIPGFNPPKYHTKYDSYFDNAISLIQDEFLHDDVILYATALDANGYIPTHNTRFKKPMTGNEEKDLMGNRTKRIFDDPFAARAIQNKEKGFLQIYKMDTGKTVWDISSPITVKGKHWGCFKIGFDLENSEKNQKVLLKSLFIGVAVFLFFSTGVIFYIVNRSLKPLVEFSDLACNLADGDVDEKINIDRKDEIGKVAEALERLRVSLKAAMERLMRR